MKLPARVSILAAALCLMLAVPARADGPFSRERTYSGQFSDLDAGSPFYDNVAALYEYGLAAGKGDGTFGVEDPLTVGQAVVFAGRIRSLYRTGSAEAGPAAYGDGAASYLRYLQAEGVLDTALDGELRSNATRAQMAHVLSGILPDEAPINAGTVEAGFSARRYVTDVTAYTPYHEDILELYRRGVCAGTGARGAFHPEAAITRGAAAAMLARLVDPSLRITLDWDVSESASAKGLALSDLVEPGEYIASPASAGELDSSLRWMLSGGGDTLELSYGELSLARAREVMEQSLSIVKTYCEQGYNAVSCTYTSRGGIRLSFSSACANTQSCREASMEAAAAVHDQLWADGLLTPGMSEKEKARVYFTWVCENCAYDYGAGDDSDSHTPYGLFARGAAVCDGYTGAYNLLLKLEGIRCRALAGNRHIWTVAELDGTECHIDATWGDNGCAVDYDFFAMTEAQSRAVHGWDSQRS